MSLGERDVQDFIYHLVDADGVVRYVGLSNNPYFRLLNHLAVARCAYIKTPVSRWIRHLLERGEHPGVRIVRIVQEDPYGEEREERHRCLAAGWPLLNTVGVKSWQYNLLQCVWGKMNDRLRVELGPDLRAALRRYRKKYYHSNQCWSDHDAIRHIIYRALVAEGMLDQASVAGAVRAG